MCLDEGQGAGKESKELDREAEQRDQLCRPGQSHDGRLAEPLSLLLPLLLPLLGAGQVDGWVASRKETWNQPRQSRQIWMVLQKLPLHTPPKTPRRPIKDHHHEYPDPMAGKTASLARSASRQILATGCRVDRGPPTEGCGRSPRGTARNTSCL